MFICLKDAVKKYGEGEAAVYALDHADLVIRKGEICVILGPSGSGKSTILNMLGALELEPYRRRFPRELSGGQQQRAAIARAMSKNPRLLLCDELTGALDTCSSKNVLRFVEKMNRKYGTTVVIITHNEAIAKMADQIIRIRDGRVEESVLNEKKIPAVALICIIISRKVKTEQQMIGTLSAMGYTRTQLARHYAGFAAIPGIIGGVLASVVTAAAAQPYGELGLTDYEPMRITCSLSWYAAVSGIAVPAVMYVLAALLSVRRLLRQNTVLLLNGSADEGRRKLRRVLAGRKLPFRIKFAVRSLIGSPARSVVVFLGIFLGSFIMLTGFSIYDSIRHMSNTVQEAAGEYEYQYVLGELLYENPYGGELILAAPVEGEKGDTLTVMGTDNEQSFLNLTDKEGQKISTKEGYYITSLAAYLCGWETGDRVTLYNPLSLEQIHIRISGIVENDTAQIIYTSRANAAEMTGVDKNAGNAIISEGKLDMSMYFVQRKTRKVDAAECLKGQRE